MVQDLQISERQREIILRELEGACAVGGDVVELGCYAGDTSVELGRALKRWRADKKLWLYDSFEGLPEKTGADTSAIGVNFRAGELRASKAEVVRKFKKAGLAVPFVKKGWFADLDGERDLPREIAFALLDGDYYDSIRVSLKLVAPKMAASGVVIVHDYQNEALPGARRAVDEFLRRESGYKMRVEAGLAVMKSENMIKLKHNVCESGTGDVALY